MKVIIVGAGKLGLKLIESLLNGDFDVIVLDSDLRVIERVKERYDVMTFHASGLELGGLKALNLNEVDLLIAITRSDETNTLICTLGKKLGCKKTVARVRNPEINEHMEYLRSDLGVDHLINPEFITAREIARMLLKPYTLYSETFARGRLSFVSIPAKGMKDIVGKRVYEIKHLGAVTITAISKGMDFNIPNEDTAVDIEDTLYFAGLTPDIQGLLEKYGSIYKRKAIMNIVLIGGGRTAYYLAKLLYKAKMQITVVEPNRERCNFIAERLPHVLVINGDGTDIALLEEEGLHQMDAFIGITNEDEKNILLSLVAKQYNVKNTITSLSNSHYFQIMHKIGMEGAVSPIIMTISSIFKFIHGDRVASLALLHGGKAEVTEIVITEDSTLVYQKLNEVKLPEGLLILGLERGKEVLLAQSNIEVLPQDKVVIFCLTQSIASLEQLFKGKKGGFLDELLSYRQNNR